MPGKFFALPQSPQIYKQLLMIAGLRPLLSDRALLPRRGLARRPAAGIHAAGHRDLVPRSGADPGPDGRPDRTPVQARARTWSCRNPLPRMSYAEAMRRFGSDKPDLRIPLELVDVADLVKGCDFKVFAGPAADANGRVAALCVPQGGKLSRKEIDDYTAFVARYGAKGLAYVKVNETAQGRDGLQSPILKFLSDAAVAGILAAHRGQGRRPDLLRRRQRQGRERCARRAAPEGRPRLEAGGSRLAAAVGGRFPDVRMGRARPSAGRRCTTRSPVRSTRIMPRSRRARARRSPRLTTWC